MHFSKKSGWLVGAGFLLGAVGVKALTSSAAKKCYVQGVAKGMQAKAAYEGIVEQAKSEVDDIVAEAEYLNVQASQVADKAACEGAVQIKSDPVEKSAK